MNSCSIQLPRQRGIKRVPQLQSTRFGKRGKSDLRTRKRRRRVNKITQPTILCTFCHAIGQRIRAAIIALHEVLTQDGGRLDFRFQVLHFAANYSF